MSKTASESRWVKLKDGAYVKWCPCGKPPDGKGAVIRLQDGTECLAHWTCISPA